MELLLKADAELAKSLTYEHYTPIMLACLNGNYDTMKCLVPLCQQRDITRTSLHGDGALEMAIKCKHRENGTKIALLLLEVADLKAWFGSSGGTTPIALAILQANHEGVLRKLLSVCNLVEVLHDADVTYGTRKRKQNRGIFPVDRFNIQLLQRICVCADWAAGLKIVVGSISDSLPHTSIPRRLCRLPYTRNITEKKVTVKDYLQNFAISEENPYMNIFGFVLKRHASECFRLLIDYGLNPNNTLGVSLRWAVDEETAEQALSFTPIQLAFSNWQNNEDWQIDELRIMTPLLNKDAFVEFINLWFPNRRANIYSGLTTHPVDVIEKLIPSLIKMGFPLDWGEGQGVPTRDALNALLNHLELHQHHVNGCVVLDKFIHPLLNAYPNMDISSCTLEKLLICRNCVRYILQKLSSRSNIAKVLTGIQVQYHIVDNQIKCRVKDNQLENEVAYELILKGCSVKHLPLCTPSLKALSRTAIRFQFSARQLIKEPSNSVDSSCERSEAPFFSWEKSSIAQLDIPEQLKKYLRFNGSAVLDCCSKDGSSSESDNRITERNMRSSDGIRVLL